jgi:hypothetical protein
MYLCRVKSAFKDYKVGEEIFLSNFDLLMWKAFVEVLKRIREKPLMVYK